MSKLTLHGDALKVAAARLGITAPNEQKEPSDHTGRGTPSPASCDQ